MTAAAREGSRVWATEVELRVALLASGTDEAGWREKSEGKVDDRSR